MCPGTDVYMPPEAVKDKPVYTEKIDCFSFGVITVQVLTQNFPQPGDRRKEIEIEHVGVLEKRISECERRQNDISKVDPNHPLLLIALNCLKDEDFERPSAQELCNRVTILQRYREYNESLRAAQENSTPEQANISQRQRHAEQIKGLQQIIQSQLVRLKGKDQTITHREETIEAKLQEIQQLRQQYREEIQQSRQQHREEIQQLRQQHREEIEQLSQQHRKEIQQNRDVAQQVEKEKDRVIDELKSERVRAEQQISELELQLIQRNQQLLSNKEESRGNIKLSWRKGKSAPCERHYPYSIAVNGNTVYLRYTANIYTYAASTCTWSHLSSCMCVACPIVIVNNLLTTVGGREDTGKDTNKVFSLVREGGGRGWSRWTEVFSPMPTKRYASSVLCTGTALIVAGGAVERGAHLKTVEVMNTETHQWSIAIDLPEPTVSCSLVQVNNDRIYMLGGCDEFEECTKAMYMCSVSALLQSCSSHRSLGARLARYLLPTNIIGVWSKVSDLPVTRSAYVSLHGRLLAVGGEDSERKPTSALHMYDPSTKSWQVISHLATPRCRCFAAVLPDNELMVVGGNRTGRDEVDSVEIATVTVDP